jgi:predicted RNase H-like HicB family nuclease
MAGGSWPHCEWQKQPDIRFMLAQYLDLAVEMARYEIIEDDHSYWGEIPGFQGVWATHETLPGCQRELREALSDWVALRLRLGLEIPEVGRLNLNRIGLTVHA